MGEYRPYQEGKLSIETFDPFLRLPPQKCFLIDCFQRISGR
jgi:hypothetical protein